jgi:hypothetical protein
MELRRRARPAAGDHRGHPQDAREDDVREKGHTVVADTID